MFSYAQVVHAQRIKPVYLSQQKRDGVPPKILCLDQFAFIGGGQQCLLDLIPGFLQWGGEIEVIVPGDGPFARKLLNRGASVRFFQGADLSSKQKQVWEMIPYWSGIASAKRSIRDAIRERRPDLLYVNGPRYLSAAAWIAIEERIPVLFHAHHRIQQRAALAITRRALRRTSGRVIACCEYVAASLRSHLPTSAIDVVYNGAPDMAGKVPRRIQMLRTLGVLGRIAPEKGQLEFICALQKVAPSHPDLRVLIMGNASKSDKYYREVVGAARGLKVSFTGWVDNVAGALAGIDMLVVPSSPHDAAPRVVLEAFSAGVPVLACPSGGIPELVSDGVNGFLTAGSEPDQIADRLSDVLALPVDALDYVVRYARAEWEARYALPVFQKNVWAAVLSSMSREVAMGV